MAKKSKLLRDLFKHTGGHGPEKIKPQVSKAIKDRAAEPSTVKAVQKVVRTTSPPHTISFRGHGSMPERHKVAQLAKHKRKRGRSRSALKAKVKATKNKRELRN